MDSFPGRAFFGLVRGPERVHTISKTCPATVASRFPSSQTGTGSSQSISGDCPPNVQLMASEVAIGDPEKLIMACAMDPLTSAVPTLQEIPRQRQPRCSGHSVSGCPSLQENHCSRLGILRRLPAPLALLSPWILLLRSTTGSASLQAPDRGDEFQGQTPQIISRVTGPWNATVLRSNRVRTISQKNAYFQGTGGAGLSIATPLLPNYARRNTIERWRLLRRNTHVLQR